MLSTISDGAEFVIFILQWVGEKRLHHNYSSTVHRLAQGESSCVGRYHSSCWSNYLYLEIPKADDHAYHPLLPQAVPDVIVGVVDSDHERLQHQPAVTWPGE